MFLLLVLLGIGVDQMFLIVAALDRTKESDPLIDRIANGMGEVGLNMLLSILTSAIAFATTIPCIIPAISGFCAYAVCCLTFIFVAFMTLVIPLLVYDQRRIIQHKHALLPCVRMQVSDTQQEQVHALTPFGRAVKWFYMNVVTHPVGAAIIIFVFLSLTIHAGLSIIEYVND